MNYSIKNVSEREFGSLDAPMIFDVNRADRRFAELEIGNARYGLAWQSDILEPDIEYLDDGVALVCIDLIFAVVSTTRTEVLAKRRLDTFYRTMIQVPTHVLVATDTQIYWVNKEDYLIERSKGLPDTFLEFGRSKGSVFAVCHNGERVLLLPSSS